ncbi:MAG: hypothetical protein IJ766_01955 [Clostridia bacterium]|nr:hypothetical protein [Clostridia bacterium]
MNGKDLFEAINNVDESLLNDVYEIERPKQAKLFALRYAAAAAVVAVTVITAFSVHRFRIPVTPDPSSTLPNAPATVSQTAETTAITTTAPTTDTASDSSQSSDTAMQTTGGRSTTGTPAVSAATQRPTAAVPAVTTARPTATATRNSAPTTGSQEISKTSETPALEPSIPSTVNPSLPGNSESTDPNLNVLAPGQTVPTTSGREQLPEEQYLLIDGKRYYISDLLADALYDDFCGEFLGISRLLAYDKNARIGTNNYLLSGKTVYKFKLPALTLQGLSPETLETAAAINAVVVDFGGFMRLFVAE